MCDIWIITIVFNAVYVRRLQPKSTVRLTDQLYCRAAFSAVAIVIRLFFFCCLLLLFFCRLVYFYRFTTQDSNVSTVSSARNPFRRSCCSLNYNMMKFGSKNSTNTPIKCTIRLLDDSQLLDSEFQVDISMNGNLLKRINVSFIIISQYKI